MKKKYTIISKFSFSKWCDIGNLFAKSLCPRNLILKQYNNLSASQRIEIKKRFNDYDSLRRKRTPKGDEDAWIIGVMVDAHIIAYEYDIDPLTAVMCINPVCKATEKLIVK